MTQQQLLRLFLPILIVVPVLYFRMRRMSRAQPLKLDRLWVRPALFLAVAAVGAAGADAAQPSGAGAGAAGFAWLALAGGAGRRGRLAVGPHHGHRCPSRKRHPDGAGRPGGHDGAGGADPVPAGPACGPVGRRRRPGTSICCWFRTPPSSSPRCCSPCAAWKCISGPAGDGAEAPHKFRLPWGAGFATPLAHEPYPRQRSRAPPHLRHHLPSRRRQDHADRASAAAGRGDPCRRPGQGARRGAPRQVRLDEDRAGARHLGHLGGDDVRISGRGVQSAGHAGP